MGTRLTESAMYSHLWRSEEFQGIFDESARLQTWLEILVALAEAQAECGIIPREVARTIALETSIDRLDLDLVAEETRLTSHSTLGLIRGLEQMLPPSAARYVFYGTTVQDVTDTWIALVMRGVGRATWRHLRAIETSLLDLAVRHRDDVMAGRTHGQQGAPITFGFKAATWADEIRRHLDRLRQARGRLLVGQLGGAVGTLGFFGSLGPELRSRFCAKLGLADPGISWLTTRDRIAEFVHLLAMISATLGRIGDEIYELQRTEIGELREPAPDAAVSSITMPHKRNPEGSEHLVTLARLVRAQANIVLEAAVQSHERDGRAWKTEWVAFPEACLLTGAALDISRRILQDLHVDVAAMAEHVAASQGYLWSERVLAELSPRLGKHRAQTVLQEALNAGQRRGLPLREAVLRADGLKGIVDTAELERILDKADTGSAGAMIDLIVSRGRAAQQAEEEVWA